VDCLEAKSSPVVGEQEVNISSTNLIKGTVTPRGESSCIRGCRSSYSSLIPLPPSTCTISCFDRIQYVAIYRREEQKSRLRCENQTMKTEKYVQTNRQSIFCSRDPPCTPPSSSLLHSSVRRTPTFFRTLTLTSAAPRRPTSFRTLLSMNSHTTQL